MSTHPDPSSLPPAPPGAAHATPNVPPVPALKPPAHMAALVRDWPTYFARVEGEPPRQTLLDACAAFGATAGLAADLGAGDGRDTQAMLERGWRVIAFEPHPEGRSRLAARPLCQAALRDGRLELRSDDFDAMRLPALDLVNASFSLPFCPPRLWAGVWARVRASIRPGGRFAGQLFGDRDSWSTLEDRVHLTRAEVLDCFADFVLEHLREEDRPSKYEGEGHKHWHVFHLVARKR
ncbi:MAG: class I SAM-dependent methyltransferase [Phycisphaerales bacterium]|nr:class I SAM-dependent methyltransferase [Phycisphaerales bacterium]